MSTGNIAYLIMVLCAFGAFMVVLSYGYIRCALADRRQPAKRADVQAEPARKAA